MTRVIWCTPGRNDEADLISAITAAGCTVVRRCLEAVDLLAAAEVEPRAQIVVDIAVPGLGADLVARIQEHAIERVVGLVDGDPGTSQARAWGIERIVDMRDADATESVIGSLREGQSASQAGATTPAALDRTAADRRQRGKIVAVTGPPGAPGRSTVALGLAEAWATSGERVCVVDADTCAPALAYLAGITENVSGLLVAARYADQGALDARSLGSACRQLTDRLWILTGIGSPDRWSGATPAVLDRILAACAEHFDKVVIDAGTLLDTTPIDDPFAARHERDGATISALRASDSAVVVCRPDPIGIVRLIHQLPLIAEHAETAEVRVLVNRPSGSERKTGARVADALLEAGIALPVHTLREDSSVATCVARGALLGEVTTTVRLRKSLSRISRELAA